MLKLTDSTVKWLKNTADRLKGSARRIFMAETVEQLGYGGASAAQDKLGWNRGTIRKGEKELKNGPIQDLFSDRGCKKSEEFKELPKNNLTQKDFSMIDGYLRDATVFVQEIREYLFPVTSQDTCHEKEDGCE